MASTLLAGLKRQLYMAVTFAPRVAIRAVNALISLKTREGAFHSPELFDWVKSVEEMHPLVRREAEQMIRFITDMPTNHEMLPTTGYYFSERDWRHVGFHVYGAWIDAHCALYPNTREAFSRIPGLVAATMSILPPGETVPDHIHSYKGLLIYHLGVALPKNADKETCGMRVGDEVRTWEEGKSLVIDPMWSHETWNHTNEFRAIMLAEFRRPDMPGFMRFMDRLFVFGFRHSPLGRMLIRQISTRADKHLEHVRRVEAAGDA